ncbi:unnamed protein product [Umbelopsis ramanniana]
MTTRETDTPLASIPVYLLICWSLTLCLLLLATASLSKWPLRLKQMLSIPLMITAVLAPLLVHSPFLVLDLITGALTAGLLHRFVDVFWVQPILYNQPAWIPWKQVEMDLMSAQYKYKQAKLDSENKNASITVRSCFYLVPSILVSFLVTDVLGALLTTYSKEDVFYAEKYNGWRYLIVFVVGLSAVNACFSYAGDLNQFTAALLAGGTYVEEHWKPMMPYPYKATSLGRLWSYHWHQCFRSFWLSVPYHPARKLCSQFLGKYLSPKMVKPITMAVSTISVFFFSGCLHEYVNVILLGPNTYPKYAGFELKFFVSHGVAVVLEKLVSQSISPYIPDRTPYNWMKAIVGWAWVMSFTYYTFPLFFSSFVELEIWQVLTMGLTKEWFNETALETPWLRALCGGLL